MTTRRIATDAQNPLGKSVICIPIALVTLGVLVGGYANGECEPEEAVDVRPVADEAGGVDGTPEDERAAAESEDSAGDGGAAAVYEEWPFDAEEAKRRQRETAEALGIPVEKTLDLGDGVTMTLVLIPAGEFVMGSPADEERRDDDEGPQRRVMLTKPFYVGAYEVTKVQFAQFVSDSGYKTTAEKQGWSYAWKGGGGWGKIDGASWRKPGFAQGDDHPVVCVSHDDASAFCRWLSRKHGARVRLPSEAQWEYAARAGTRTVYPWGDDPDGGQGWANAADRTAKEKYSGWIVFNWSDGYVFTAPVGGFRSNGFGLHDTVGNVWEWCADWYQDSYEGLATEDPKGPKGGKHGVQRGGSWCSFPWDCRSALRSWSLPVHRSGGIGFRVVVLGGDPRGKEATGDGEDEREEAGDGGAAAVYEEWPFDAEEAKRRQRETAAALGVPVEKTLDLGDGVTMKLVLIPAGRFVMGSPAGEEHRDDDEGPQRRVTLTEPFYMGVCEVTQAQYEQVIGETPWRGKHFAKTGTEHAASYVSWDEATAFCEKLSARTGLDVQLPTEARWEYACRAGSTTRYCYGDDDGKLGAYAWYDDNAYDVGDKYAHTVGRKKPNAFGLYDMHGNVYEWCADWYQDSYRGLATEDPKGPRSGKYRVLRGGSWGIARRWYCRSADRIWLNPDNRNNTYDVGFRVVVLGGDPRGKEATGDGEDEREEAGDGGAAAVYEEWPFDAEEAKRRQRETAAALGVPVEKTLDLGDGVTMKLVLIPAGRFVMGSPAGEEHRDDDEGPQRRVTLTEPFYMGVCEVTQAQYEQVIGETPWRGKHFAKTGTEHAASYVSWDEATAFCEKLSARTGLDVQLPTEARWEYACRAGSTTRYCYGDDAGKLGAYAWYDDNADDAGEEYAHGVGRKRPNAFGLYDMHGNVSEWCADWYQDSYRGLATEAPKGPRSGKYRVLRGGSWNYLPRNCRSAGRYWFIPDYRFSGFGFRVVVLGGGVDLK
ncbi:MAG: SUMF1/EgtB/PvdO family nonheme iron enzyme [Phycisphaerae bacterium]|nr:SUMF1/EgtB/PvdO family nonheme iron enzyme [Phycisphaerae bacterium]